jgi:mitochondrial fission protein ELM1
MIWDGEGPNPLFAFLHAADNILVTEDSANMAAEAASTGKPVQVLPMVALKPPGKFARLHADLEAHGATRPFDGTLESWTYEPLAETDRAARAVLEAMRAR